MLGDEHQPQRVVARAARVLVEPRARGWRWVSAHPSSMISWHLPAHGPDVGRARRRRERGAALHLPLDVLDGREHQRRREPLGQAGEVEQRQRRVVGDGGRPVGDVGERAVLAVGLEPQQQRLQRVGVGRRSAARWLARSASASISSCSRGRSPVCWRSAVDGVDAGAHSVSSSAVERAHSSLGVVGVTDQQRVQREQELALLRRHLAGVGDVPRADHGAAGRADLDAREPGISQSSVS